MGNCAKRAFENGGSISKADQLMAEMEKKYGVSGKSAPAPAPAPQSSPQPAPQPQGIASGIGGIFKGRQNQLDQQERKAIGYSNGGKIQGPGTPTSDSIPAKVKETGEEIRVSNGERIVSAAQGALLEALARKSGFDSLDALLEAGTGKPVGPTIKGGKMAAEDGLYLDNNPDEYNNALREIVPPVFNDAEKVGPSTTPSIAGQMLSPVTNLLADSAQAARGEKTYEQIRADRLAQPSGISAAAKPVTQSNPLTSAAPGSSFAPSKEQFSLPDTRSEFLTGKNGAMPDSSGGGFVSGNTAYTVNPTSQEGISRVTAAGKNPLITNIDPQKAVAGLSNQTIGQPADEAAQGIARIANANKIRGEMIANRDKDIPAGGYGPSILADRSVEDNAALDAMRRSSMVSNLSPSQQAEFNMNLARMAQQERGQNLAADTARYTADTQEKRAAGHDQTLATIEANKLAGNPLEQQAKQLDLKQKGIIAGLFEKANAGDKDALVKYNALTSGGKEPNYSNRYVTVQGGEETGPDGTTKIRRPSRVFDAQTGQWVNEGGQGATAPQQAPASAIDFLKKNPGQAEAFKAKYGYLPTGF